MSMERDRKQSDAESILMEAERDLILERKNPLAVNENNIKKIIELFKEAALLDEDNQYAYKRMNDIAYSFHEFSPQIAIMFWMATAENCNNNAVKSTANYNLAMLFKSNNDYKNAHFHLEKARQEGLNVSWRHLAEYRRQSEKAPPAPGRVNRISAAILGSVVGALGSIAITLAWTAAQVKSFITNKEKKGIGGFVFGVILGIPFALTTGAIGCACMGCAGFLKGVWDGLTKGWAQIGRSLNEDMAVAGDHLGGDKIFSERLLKDADALARSEKTAAILAAVPLQQSSMTSIISAGISVAVRDNSPKEAKMCQQPKPGPAMDLTLPEPVNIEAALSDERVVLRITLEGIASSLRRGKYDEAANFLSKLPNEVKGNLKTHLPRLSEEISMAEKECKEFREGLLPEPNARIRNQ